MSVDFRKPPRILVVHGVQKGGNDELDQHEVIKGLVNRSLMRTGVSREFDSALYKYENINDEAQDTVKLLSKLLLGALGVGAPLAALASDTVIDIVGDVISASLQSKTAITIRQGLVEMILEAYEQQIPQLIVAHSLGTVYSLDAINHLMERSDLFDRADISTWPVQGWITLGSPLGLNLLGRNHLAQLRGDGTNRFPWYNYWNPMDPVVSGSVLGRPEPLDAQDRGPAGRRFSAALAGSSWNLREHKVTSGKQWLLAHTAYWDNPSIGDSIVNLLWEE